MDVVWSVLSTVLWLYFLVMIARLVLDYVRLFNPRWQPRGIVLVLVEGVYTVTDPPLRLFRRIIPPLRVGGIQLDLSFMVVLLILNVAILLVPA